MAGYGDRQRRATGDLRRPAYRARDAVEDVILNRRDDGTERLPSLPRNIAAAKPTTPLTPSRRVALVGSE